MLPAIIKKLLDWYHTHQRELPWRGAADPYAVLVSEFMLQQTRVETVIPYYKRWMARFPTLESLARAPREDVLRLWEGLGYYRRAHNLHAAATVISAEHGGRLPSDTDTLMRLPGVGRYTAAALRAIAFNQPELALDGNLRRVLARLFDLDVDPRRPQGERRLREEVAPLIPPRRGGDFNQALMDLGSLICTSRNPDCAGCPLNRHCLAFNHGTVSERPVRAARPKLPHLHAAAGVIERDGRVLIGRRPEGKLLGGLWEFPGGKPEPEETLPEALARELHEELGVEVTVGEALGTFSHAYTHFKVTVHAFACRQMSGRPQALDHSEIAWVPIAKLDDYPMGKVDRRIAERLQG